MITVLASGETRAYIEAALTARERQSSGPVTAEISSTITRRLDAERLVDV
jgi:hypothetical protein